MPNPDQQERKKAVDLAGNDVADCDYCVAFQFRDWDTVKIMQESGQGCTCEPLEDK